MQEKLKRLVVSSTELLLVQLARAREAYNAVRNAMLQARQEGRGDEAKRLSKEKFGAVSVAILDADGRRPGRLADARHHPPDGRCRRTGRCRGAGRPHAARAAPEPRRDAAKEIKQLIGSSAEKVEGGSRLVPEAGEQTQGITQLSASVADLDRMTQQNAALVEQSAAADESLKMQAQQVAQAMHGFRLEA